MPTVRFNTGVFEHYAGKKLPLEQLKDRISFLGTDLEGIEDEVITVEVFPNRPDLLSVQGFARAFSSFIGHKTGLREYRAMPSRERVIIEKAVSSVRPYTSCAIVKGIRYDDEKIREIIDIQEKLHITYGRNRRKVAIGIYPFEKIQTPIRFTAKRPEDIVFRPLEGSRRMNAREILEKHPTGQQYGHLLAGQKTFPVFLDANDQVLSVPPIINSHEVGKITPETTDVFVECSGFDYGLQHTCLNMIVTAMADMGGKVYSMELAYPDKTIVSPDFSPQEIAIDLPYINKRLGLSLTEKEFEKLLGRMGFGFKGKKALVPCYRADILHQIDIGEDIAIAHGYENFEEIIPKVATVAREAPIEAFKGKLAELLVGLGMQEVSTYHLSNEDHQSTRMNASFHPVKLANAISQEYHVLRAWLLPGMMDVLGRNTSYEYPQRIFQMGAVFSKDAKEETGVGEARKLAVAVSHERADYTEIRQAVEYLLRSLGLADWKVAEHDHPSFIAGRCAAISVGKQHLAFMGELSPLVLKSWGLEMPAVAAEMDVAALFSLVFQGKR